MHYHRRKYVGLAYPFFDPDKSIDLWYGPAYLYGKVDEKNKLIILKDDRVKNFSEASNIFAVDFVVDAYEDFRDFINAAAQQRKIDYNNSWLKAMVPSRGYIDPVESQGDFLEIFDEIFSKKYFNSNNKFKEVRNIFDYIEVFFEFFKKVASKTPITISSQLISKISSPLSSGLMIDLAPVRHDNDRAKYEIFVQDSNFSFYQNAARKFGFRLDYNAPWRLVAHLASVEMRSYMEKYGIDSYVELFDVYYMSPSYVDVLILKNFIFKSYNNFVDNFPFTKTVSVSKNGTKTKSCFINRTPLGSAEQERLFDQSYWLKFYFKVRSLELKISWTPAAFAKASRYIEKLEKGLDIEAALMYIDDQLLKR